MGLMGQRPTAIDQMFIPLESYGVKTVSMEMFKPETDLTRSHTEDHFFTEC